MSLTYPLDGSRTAITCPTCGQAVRVDLHGQRLSLRCYGGCPEEAVLALVDRDAVVAEIRNGANHQGQASRGKEKVSSPSVDTATSWAAIELAPVLAGEEIDPPPTMLTRADGVCLLYPGRIHQVSGEPESGKGWLACLVAAEVLPTGHVAYFDFEDSPASVVSRMRALGVEDGALLDRFMYAHPDEPLVGPGEADLAQMLDREPQLVVIDGVTEALTIHGLDLASNTDIATWLEMLPRRLVKAGAAVLLIDHVTKDKESRARYALGAQHKLAGVDVAYGLEVLEPFGRGRDGLVKVRVHKDRPGHVRRFADEDRIAEMRLTSDLGTGRVKILLDAPADLAEFRPTFLMGKTWQAIADNPGITVRRLREEVQGKNNDAKKQALDLLVREGFVKREQDGRAVRHHVVKPFFEEAATPDRAYVPNRAADVPGTPAGNVPDVPRPPRGQAPGAPRTATAESEGPCLTPVDAFVERALVEFPGSHELAPEAA